MWKQIEIKPMDSILVGSKIRPACWPIDTLYTVLFVGNTDVFIRRNDGYELSWTIKTVWQIWEEPKRWRAYDIREMSFWYVASNLDVFCDQDSGDDWDEKFECGNYFRTKQQAQTYAEECKKLAMKLHESWGE